MLSLIGHPANRTLPLSGLTVARPQQSPYCRPMLMRLEEREVLSSPASIAAPAPIDIAGQLASITNLTFNITSIALNQAGTGLVAVGTVAGQVFSTPLTLTADPPATDGACPILHLELGPIHLNLLGLNVDTSKICLDVSAQPGSGNLLGNLLCDVGNLLNGGTPLSNILGGLTAVQPTSLLTGLTGLLNGVLGQTLNTATPTLGTGHTHGGGQAGSGGGHTCDILNLSVAPVDLNLLGLEVSLDNCDGGPVTVDVTAQRGPGNLLGNLLCGVSSLLDSNAAATAILQRLNRLTSSIDQIFTDLNLGGVV